MLSNFMCPDGQSCVDFIRKMVKLGLWIQKVEFGILRSKGEGGEIMAIAWKI